MTAYNNRIVYLSDAQRQELFSNGSITVGGVTINYDPSDIYVTPQAVNLTIGTVTTLPAGSAATVTIRGTVDNPILDFGIPEGEKGEPGSADDLPTDETAMQLVEALYAAAGYTDGALNVIGSTFDHLPQDETAQEASRLMALENDRLETLYERVSANM